MLGLNGVVVWTGSFAFFDFCCIRSFLGGRKRGLVHGRRHLTGRVARRLNNANGVTRLTSYVAHLHIGPISRDGIGLGNVGSVSNIVNIIRTRALRVVLKPKVIAGMTSRISEVANGGISSISSSSRRVSASLRKLTTQAGTKLGRGGTAPFGLFLEGVTDVFVPLVPTVITSNLVTKVGGMVVGSNKSPRSALIRVLSLVN